MGEVNEVNFEAVVFDCDGLLLDTEKSWQKGERAIFERYAKPYTSEAKRRLFGTGVEDVGPILSELLEQPGREEELVGEMFDICRVFVLDEANPMPGAKELVASLSGRAPLGVASNSPTDLVREILGETGILEHLDVVLGSHDVDRSKPAPDIYVLACAKLGAKPERAVAFEDSPTGTMAAKAAGMFVVGVPSEPDVSLDADLVVPSLEDERVRELLFG